MTMKLSMKNNLVQEALNEWKAQVVNAYLTINYPKMPIWYQKDGAVTSYQK